MKKYYFFKIYLTICFSIFYTLVEAQCESVGFYNSDQKQTTVAINRCEFTSVIIPLLIPFAHPKVEISPKFNSLSGDVNVTYVNKFININANITQNPEFPNPEFTILVSDSLNPSLICTLNLKVESIPCILPVKKVESILADCDSLHGGLIIKRIAPCKVVVKNTLRTEVYSKEYKEITPADTIPDLQVGAYTIDVYGYNNTGNLIPIQNMYEIISLPKKIGISTPYNKKIICEGTPIVLSVPKAEKYIWSTGDTTQMISVSKPGKVSVIFTNTVEKNCMQKDTIDLVLNPKLTFEVIQERKDCTTDSVTIRYIAKGGKAPYTFSDYANNSCMDSDCLKKQDSITKHTFAYAGYSAYLTDVSGCSVLKSYFIFPSPAYLSITSLFPKTFCQGDSTLLYVPNAAGKKYVWYLNGKEIQNVDTNVFTAKISGKYSVSILDNGCEIHSDTVLVNVLSLDPIPVYTNSPVTCLGVPVVYTTDQNKKEYTWKFPNQVKGIDYTINHGGTDTSNLVAVQWLTPGMKQVVLSYSNGVCNAIPTYVATEVIVPIYLDAISPLKSNTCVNTENTYHIKIMNPMNNSGIQTPLFWSIPGNSGADYMILAGGGGFDTSITVKWLKPNNHVISVSNLINCGGNTLVFEVNVIDTVSPKKLITDATSNLCKLDSLKLAVNSLANYDIQWYFNGNVVTNAKDSLFYAKAVGEYYAIISNAGKCSYQTPKFVYVKDNCAGISKNSEEEVLVYPNPTTAILHVDFTSYNDKKIQVVSLAGQVVLEQLVTKDKNEILVDHLPNGMYILQLMNSKNELIYREKVTIQQ